MPLRDDTVEGIRTDVQLTDDMVDPKERELEEWMQDVHDKEVRGGSFATIFAESCYIRHPVVMPRTPSRLTYILSATGSTATRRDFSLGIRLDLLLITLTRLWLCSDCPSSGQGGVMV